MLIMDALSLSFVNDDEKNWYWIRGNDCSWWSKYQIKDKAKEKLSMYTSRDKTLCKILEYLLNGWTDKCKLLMIKNSIGKSKVYKFKKCIYIFR